MGARKKREIEEEHENHERWMVTYADMVTLLMVLFIVMFSMSQVDGEKFNSLKRSLSAGFGSSATMMDGSQSVLNQPGNSAAEALAPGEGKELSVEQQAAVEDEVRRQQRLKTERTYGEAVAEVDRLVRIRDRIEQSLDTQGLGDDIVTTFDNRGLVISLVSRHVVFAAHRAELTPRGTEVVDALGKVLRPLPDPLQLDGHTNQVPVQPKYYETDWDLSAARAITVLRHLNEKHKVSSDRLTASAFGPEKPLIDPEKPGSQRINKRVDVVVLSDLPVESRELLEQAANERGEN